MVQSAVADYLLNQPRSHVTHEVERHAQTGLHEPVAVQWPWPEWHEVWEVACAIHHDHRPPTANCPYVTRAQQNFVLRAVKRLTAGGLVEVRIWGHGRHKVIETRAALTPAEHAVEYAKETEAIEEAQRRAEFSMEVTRLLVKRWLLTKLGRTPIDWVD